MSRKSTKGSAKTAPNRPTEPSFGSEHHRGSATPTSTSTPNFPSRSSKLENADEEIPLPEATRERSFTREEAEAALRDLFQNGTDNTRTLPDDDDAVVHGFREGIRLLSHRIPARSWMHDREDPTKKKAGGILADEMGLGKTLQLLTRVVDDSRRQRDGDRSEMATLVVCPLALVQQWDEEIKKFTVGLTVVQYHGAARKTMVSRFPTADIVLTTYGIVGSEHLHASVLFTTNWRRVVLDEAHTIKNRKTKTAEACWDLRAKFRWRLMATPMQNKVEDFFPLIKFLCIKPLNDWDRFNTLIAKPLSKGPDSGLAMRRLQVVLKHVMLRRTKAQIVLKLPACRVELVRCKFDSSEYQFYAALKENVQTLLRRILAQTEKSGKVYMHVSVLILRLRQACDHPYLVLNSYGDDTEDISSDLAPNMFKDMDVDDNDDGRPKCHVCTSRTPPRRTGPGHCINCAAFKVQAENLNSPIRASAKIRTIVRLLKAIGQVSGGQEKTVIFSQFSAMLDVLEPFLMAIGVDFVRYDGAMSPKERKEALTEIATNPRKTVILVSLKAGGVGLNLTACNHVILVDMWWNPAVEEQAYDQTHRVGQTRDVHIYKLKIDDTIEDRIMELQEKKRQLAKMALSGDHIKGMKLGMSELLQLFK
ncbi:SNF2 family N-terminal domain-containing protein [Mycena maculata]|uniref:SNF2 family N-terminal domain-containing protein n=1 Tax=Mycena maculata TaxID=230809 RepID=A0AAD7N578_9AGAR|nr:SNF2 family N-terminal domain-containing protein [Mycena maculata]